jgi:phage baseplate assembly protein W
MANILYRGFSTLNQSKKFRLIEFELVKRDLINHFNIRKGEKLMQPDFGTIIWSLLFEPMTDVVRNQIVDDIKSIVNYDPRIGVNSINLTELDYGLQVEIELVYLQTDQSSNLVVQFDRDSQSISAA